MNEKVCRGVAGSAVDSVLDQQKSDQMYFDGTTPANNPVVILPV
jgi:hypothetical protein